MLRMKLTKRTVDALQSDGDERRIWDTDIAGFGVRCRGAAGKYYFLSVVQTREWRMRCAFPPYALLLNTATAGEAGGTATPVNAGRSRRRRFDRGASR
jgi:hypothetical protein